MAYITSYNAANIIFKANISALKLSGSIFSTPIYFFNNFEKRQLLAYKEFIQDPDSFIQEVYKAHPESKDSYRLMYEKEGNLSSFHLHSDCPRLNADYENYIIPESIRFDEVEAGRVLNKARVKEFRQWFETVKDVFETDKEAFVNRLFLRWGIVENPRALEKSNSGIQEIVNYDINELELEMTLLIKDAGRYFYASKKNESILRKYSRVSFLGFRNEELDDNDTGYSDEEVKEFLRDYDGRFKKPLKIRLREYYRLAYNPTLDMNGQMLQTLNFKPCTHCHKSLPENEKIEPIRGQFRQHGKAISVPVHIQDHEEHFHQSLNLPFMMRNIE